MKTAIVMLCLSSAIMFATIFALPAADPGSAPKAWAHGVGYVFPRLCGTLVFAFVAVVLWGIEVKKLGVRQAFKHPAIRVAFVLLLPAVYTFVFLVRIIVESL